jgi:bifunctional ADP-heptose synthase (sugar kinase/adenylyltransferase)
MSRILVIGDSCRDVFVYCDSDRLCPDIPVPVLNILDQRENPGMAKNVQRNISSLKVSCDVITNKNWHNYTKTRYVHRKSNHMFFRVDSGCISSKFDISEIKNQYDIVVISDYNKGYISESDIEQICGMHENVFIDTKKTIGSWCSLAKFIKINNHEYERSKKFITKDLENKLIVTSGDCGCTYNGINYPVRKVEVMDVSGAGDTFMAGLVVKYLHTKDISKSIMFANECASEIVRHVGVNCIGDFL